MSFTPYFVHDGSSGHAYYVASRPGEIIAASVRQEVSQTIADFLNGLPAGISPQEVLHAIGLGKPHGALKFPETWKYGQLWSESDPRQFHNRQLTVDIADSREDQAHFT